MNVYKHLNLSKNHTCYNVFDVLIYLTTTTIFKLLQVQLDSYFYTQNSSFLM